MEKRRINKLVVPITLKSVSLFSAFTVMATSLTSCKSNKKINNDDISSSITTTSSDDELTYSSEISEEITSSELEENNSQIESTTSNTSHQNSKPNVSTPSQTPSTILTPSDSIDNTPQADPTPSTNEIDEFIPLTADNINDVNIFKRAVNEVARNTRGNFGGMWGYYYKKELYEIYGFPENEFTYVLTCFNKDNLSEDTIMELLGSYNEEEIKRFMYIIDAMIVAIKNKNLVNNWSGLIVNNQNLIEISNIEKGYLECINNNDITLLRQLVMNYDNTNPVIGYYLVSACSSATRIVNVNDADFIDKYLDLYFRLKDDCEIFATDMYNISHGKSKVLE